MIISNKHGIYELPNKLSNDLRITFLGNNEILGKSQKFIRANNLGHNIMELYNVLVEIRLTTNKTKRDT